MSACTDSMFDPSFATGERPRSGWRDAMRTMKSASWRWRTTRRPRNPVPPNTVTSMRSPSLRLSTLTHRTVRRLHAPEHALRRPLDVLVDATQKRCAALARRRIIARGDKIAARPSTIVGSGSCLDPWGATGDLSRRRLLPGLFHLVRSGFIPGCRIIGVSLDELDAHGLRKIAREALDGFSS